MMHKVKTYYAGKGQETNLQVVLGMLALLSSTSRATDPVTNYMPGSIMGGSGVLNIKETRDDLEQYRNGVVTETTVDVEHLKYEIQTYQSFFDMWIMHGYPGHLELMSKGFHHLEYAHTDITPLGISLSFKFDDTEIVNTFLTNDFLSLPPDSFHPELHLVTLINVE